MKTFIFDLYNTLIDVRTDEHCEKAWLPVVDMLDKRGIKTNWQTLCAAFDAYWQEFETVTAKQSKFQYPECDCVEQFQSIAKRVGGKLSRADAATALCAMRKASRVWLRLFDGTLELLDGLRARGAKIYLLSNAQSAFTPAEIAEVGLSDKFDGIKLSSDYGCRKPDPAFYQILFDEFGIDKRGAVMVGDDPENDGNGAKNFGIDFILADGGAAAHAAELYAFAERDRA